MAVVSMKMPDEMIEFAVPSNKDEQLKINAMILYPYIQQGMISHGRAAEILGMFKIDLITLLKLPTPHGVLNLEKSIL